MAKIENPLTVVKSGGEEMGAVVDLRYVYAIINQSAYGYFGAANSILPEEVTVYLKDGYKGALPCFNAVTTIKKVTINCNDCRATSASEMFYMASNLEEVTLNLSTKYCTAFGMFFRQTKVKNVYGLPLDFSGLTTAPSDRFFESSRIEQIRFKENTLGLSSAMLNTSAAATLSDESLVSFANCLKDGISETVTVRNDLELRLDAILGTVSLDPTETFHIFAADPDGDTTLTEFITNVKGWTIA